MLTKERAWSLIAGAAAISAALGMKAFYSDAGSTDLLWILAPSAWLARFVGGLDLVYEPGAGFISYAHRMVIDAACAGINFLVICFLTLYFSFAKHFPAKGRWLVSSAVIAFAAAVFANGLRIFVSAHLWDAEIYGSWITPGRMHRFAGTVIYYVSLLAVYLVVDSRIGARAHRVAPLFWYLGVSLGLPLVGRFFFGGTSGFSEHAAWVAGVAIAVTLGMFLPSMLRNRVFWRT